MGRAIAQRIKSYPGIPGLSPALTRRGGLAPDVGLSCIRGCSRSSGWAVRPLKRHASWVQNVETVRSLSVAGVGNLRDLLLAMRPQSGPYRWCCLARVMLGSYVGKG